MKQRKDKTVNRGGVKRERFGFLGVGNGWKGPKAANVIIRIFSWKDSGSGEAYPEEEGRL